MDSLASSQPPLAFCSNTTTDHVDSSASVPEGKGPVNIGNESVPGEVSAKPALEADLHRDGLFDRNGNRYVIVRIDVPVIEKDELKGIFAAVDKTENEAVIRRRQEEKKKLVKSKERRLRRLRFWSTRSSPNVEKEAENELGEPKLPQPYEEIKRLLEIERSPIYAKALAEWSRKETLFTLRVERKKKKVANLKNEIYQLIGFFSVFQGVLLTAVSQSNLLHCNNWWSPIVLSLVASVVTIFGVVQKLMQINQFQKTIHSEEQSLKEVIGRLYTLRREGVEKFEFARYANLIAKKQETSRFWIYFSLVIGSLLVFTAGFPLSHWRILCDPGFNPFAAAVPTP